MSLSVIDFKNFITLQRGFDLPKEKRTYGKYPIIASTSITGYHNEYKIDGECVITGRSGALGEIQYIKGKFWPLNTSLWVKDFKNNIPKYVYYFLKTLDLKRFNSGAGVPTLNRNDLDTLQIRIYKDAKTQRKIAGILSAYDDLIENNNKRIQILEEIAQKIYKEWFVDFKFPGHENVKFVESEMGLIPEGWEAGKMFDILDTLEAGKRPKGGINSEVKDIPSIGAENINRIGRYDFSKEKYITYEFFKNLKKGKIKNKDVLLYKDGANIGRVSMFGYNFPHKECCVNEHVFILRTNNKMSQEYLYFWLEQTNVREQIVQLNTNAAQPGINQDKVNSLNILIPEENIILEINKHLEPMVYKIFSLSKINNLLQKTRDLLLPRLISGELSVENLEVKI